MTSSDFQIEAHNSPPADWEGFVAAHPAAHLYHRPAWTELIRRNFGHPTRFITLRRDGELAGVLPVTHFKSLIFGQTGVSLPFVNYGGPLLADPAGAEPLMTFLKELRVREGWKSVEIRHDAKLETGAPFKTHKVTFILDLPENPDDLMNFFKAKLRSQIRRPGKDGFYAKRGGVDLLDVYYRVFAENMRDLGTPVLPKGFFRDILETFPEETSVVAVYDADHRPASASFLIRSGETMEIPWASSLREFNRSSPNMLLYWESFMVAMEAGCKFFDFGRCTVDAGTYRFKKQWGSREVPLYWYYALPENETLPEVSPANPKFEMMVQMWQKLPLGISNLLGPRIIRHIPG
ncbi:MAG: FemAB family PEP-CTERM system-associated protein [Calditrichaeota bacterium]|nr:FemAB family PEP-CTERM system-associated protein [Calditrichota bacterium]HQU73487.1 FemAB family PEP-CTERM system-associated protein [Calditrichia bacterium]